MKQTEQASRIGGRTMCIASTVTLVTILMALPIYLDRADASPLVAHNLATVAPASAVAGGHMAVALAGRCLLSATFGPAVELGRRGRRHRVGWPQRPTNHSDVADVLAERHSKFDS
jgi:hypothetical protein